MLPAFEEGAAPAEAKGNAPLREGLWPAEVERKRYVSRIVQSVALSCNALLEGGDDGLDMPVSDLPQRVVRLTGEDEHNDLTTVHELRGEHAAHMFPDAPYLAIVRGKADHLLARVRHEHTFQGPHFLDRRRRARWQEIIDDMAQQGLSVFGIGWRPLEELPDKLTAELERKISLLALVGILEIAHMPPATERSIARRIALQVLFELDCTEHVTDDVIVARIDAQEASRKQARYVRMLVTLVRKHLAFLDDILRNYTIDWPPEQLAVVDRNILRMAILEFAITKGAPVAVVINEAIELARLFSSEESFDFINGVLGAIAAEDEAALPPEGDALRSRAGALRGYRDSLDREAELEAIRSDLSVAPLAGAGMPVA